MRVEVIYRPGEGHIAEVFHNTGGRLVHTTSPKKTKDEAIKAGQDWVKEFQRTQTGPKATVRKS